MAYTAPPTFVAGDPLAAAELNVIGDDIEYLYAATESLTFNGVSVSRAAATSIPDSTSTAVTWSAENYDEGGWWSSGPSIVVPASAVPAGYATVACLVSARVKFGADDLGYRAMAITINGSDFVGSSVGAVDGGETEIVIPSIICILNAGDSLGMSVYHTAGHSINVAGAWLIAVRFAPV
jgi:hypothetical protein